MKIYQRVCVKPLRIEGEDSEGIPGVFELKTGQIYTTSPIREEDATVMVFTQYWQRVPVDHFEPIMVQV